MAGLPGCVWKLSLLRVLNRAWHGFSLGYRWLGSSLGEGAAQAEPTETCEAMFMFV